MEGELYESLRMVAADGENATHMIDAMKGNHPHLDPQTATLNSYAGGFLMHCPELTYDQELHAPIHHPNSTWTIGSDTSWQATDSNCLFEQDLANLSCLWDPTALVQQSLSAETQNFDYGNLSASSQGSSGELFESMPSSSTTQSELLDRFTATISRANTSSNHQYPSAFPNAAIGSRGSSKKRRRHLNSKSFSHISIKRKTSTAQLKKALARFQREIWSNKPFSNPFKTELRRLFDQFNDLFEREICLSDSFSAVTASSSASQESESNSTFSNFQEESDTSSNSATPRQPNHGFHEDELMVDEPAEPTLNLKRFQCTFPKCNYSSDRQGDWERHEAKEKHWPQEQFMCLQCNIPTSDLEGNPMCRYCSFPFSILGDARTHYLQCGFAREGAKTFRRKDHLCEHLRKDHGLTDMSERAKGWSFPIYSEWPRECGFCGIFFDTWEQRMIHIGCHYQNGAQRLSWKLPFPRPKSDVPHEPTFDPSDDDSDDEDDDGFNDGRLPQGKASNHGFLPTSSSSQPTNNALSTYQQNRFQTQGNHRSQSHSHSAHRDNQETLTLQPLVSRLPRCKPSLPLQRYLNDFEDTPYRLFTPASSQCPLKKDRTRDVGESRTSTNKSEVFHRNVRMLQGSRFPHIAGPLDNYPFTEPRTCSTVSTCSKALHRCQIVGLSATELILAAKKIFSILLCVGKPDSILEFRFSSKEQSFGDLYVLFDFTYQCVGLDLVYNAMLLPRPSQLQKVWNERLRNLHFRKYLSFRSSKHRPSPPLGISEKDLRALLNVYQNDVRRYKVLTEDGLHSAASISQFNAPHARWYAASKSDLIFLRRIGVTDAMAEPIGLAAGLLALAGFAFQASVTLYNTVQSFKFRPKQLCDLKEELEALSGILGSLTETVSATTDLDLSALDLPLLRCGNACKEFEQEILRCSSRSGGNRTSFRDWAKLRYMGDNIDGFRQLLAGYKSTINLALTDANLRKSSVTVECLEIYRDLLKTATNDLEAHLQSVDDKLESIFARALVESASAAEELRLIKEERTSAEKCLQICTQLSDHTNQIQFTPKLPDTLPKKFTTEGLQECKNSLDLTTAKLESYMKDRLNRLVSKAKTAMTSEEDFADLVRLEEEWEMTRQSREICSKAEMHLKENITTIDNYATGDAIQFMVSTDGNIAHGKNRGLGWRTRQVGGHLSDLSVQQLSRDMSSIRFQHTENNIPSSQGNTILVPDDGVENKPGFRIQGAVWVKF